MKLGTRWSGNACIWESSWRKSSNIHFWSSLYAECSTKWWILESSLPLIVLTEISCMHSNILNLIVLRHVCHSPVLSLDHTNTGVKTVLDNPTNFCNSFQFEVTFECLQELEDGEKCIILYGDVSNWHTSKICEWLTHFSAHYFIDLEWKVIYVGSAESSSHDQVLDEILVGPVPVGINKFILEADSPSSTSIPDSDILGVTVVLVTCSYKDQEFTRVGYYVNNEYTDEFNPDIGPPTPLDLTKVVRRILADKPRVTRFPIAWNKQDLIESQQYEKDSMQVESDEGLITPTKSVRFGPDAVVTPERQMENGDTMVLAWSGSQKCP